jgi:hypothetical protein
MANSGHAVAELTNPEIAGNSTHSNSTNAGHNGTELANPGHTGTELAIPGHDYGQVSSLSPVQLNAQNAQKLDGQVTELLVSSYDPVVGKTIWQCAQCHFSSKVRYNVKRHIETHISDFTHQCPHCERQCKTRNALQAHVMRAHTAGGRPSSGHQRNWPMQGGGHGGQLVNPDGIMQIQLQEMGEPAMKAPRRPPQKRPYDEELERQIRLLLISTYDPVEAKTTWRCAQCNYSNKLQYTVKQHIETHITSIVHQCNQCPKILKTRNALRVHMIQKHEQQPVRAPPWMGGAEQSPYPSPCPSPQQGQFPVQHVQQPMQQRRKRSDIAKEQTPMDIELDRQVAELMVSNYDSVLGRTSWQCAQCHFSSKVRSTVKEHIETHISGFTHQCNMCQKTCKTRNALRVHKIQAHKNKNQMNPQQQQQQQQGTVIHNPAAQQQPPPHQQQLNDHQQQQQQPQGIQPVAKKSDVSPQEQKPPAVMYQPAPPKQQMPKPPVVMEQPRQGILNHPMVGRPMYGHPMMMGHPMI